MTEDGGQRRGQGAEDGEDAGSLVFAEGFGFVDYDTENAAYILEVYKFLISSRQSAPDNAKTGPVFEINPISL